MADDDHRIDGEDHHHHQDQILLLTYPSAVYYVQSPSTHSSNTDFRNNESSTFVSPYRSENYISNPTNASQDVSRLLLSHYSSSRGSNNSFLHEKKITYDVHDDCHENGMEEIDEDDDPCLVLCETKQKKVVQENEDEDFYDDDDYEDDRRRKFGFWRFFLFGTYNSFIWVSIQIFWRLLVSFGAALFVFFLATKPPTPNMSIKMLGIRQFGLGEGVDGSGVTTKILTCNCSMALVINNKSKLFGLHIHPSTIQMSFGPLIFATSSPGNLELYASSYKSSIFKLYVGTKNKAMYGAGRTMQDMLESGRGLPLKISMSLKSNFRVVWNLITTKYNHHVECSLVLHRSYDKRHRTQTYNSDCKIISTK